MRSTGVLYSRRYRQNHLVDVQYNVYCEVMVKIPSELGTVGEERRPSDLTVLAVFVRYGKFTGNGTGKTTSTSHCSNLGNLGSFEDVTCTHMTDRELATAVLAPTLHFATLYLSVKSNQQSFE